MIYITHVRLSGGTGHEHISEVRWNEPDTGKKDTSTRATMVGWIQNGVIAKVEDSPKDVRVEVVKGNPPYLRTVADNKYTNNLLELPRF